MPKLEEVIIAQGGKIVGLNSDGLLVATRSDGTGITINIERMNTLIDSGEETMESAITRFLSAQDRILETMNNSKWQRSGLRMSLEKIEIIQSGELVHKPVSDQVIVVLEWLDPEETSLVMMTDELLSDWSITNDEAWKIASANMDEMLKAAPVEILDLEDKDLILACLSTPSSLKASLILAPGLRQHISEWSDGQ